MKETAPSVEAKRIAELERYVADLNGALEELDMLVQPNGSVTKFLKLRGFEQSKAASA